MTKDEYIKQLEHLLRVYRRNLTVGLLSHETEEMLVKNIDEVLRNAPNELKDKTQE